jgi:hypothetical protein
MSVLVCVTVAARAIEERGRISYRAKLLRLQQGLGRFYGTDSSI